MISLGGLHHVALRVADLDEAGRRWALQFGLRESGRDQGGVRLACDDAFTLGAATARVRVALAGEDLHSEVGWDGDEVRLQVHR